jgi:hypothetical protein
VVWKAGRACLGMRTCAHTQTNTPDFGVKVDAAAAQAAILDDHTHEQRCLAWVGQELVSVPPNLGVTCVAMCVCACVSVGGGGRRGSACSLGAQSPHTASQPASQPVTPVLASTLPSTPLTRAVSSSCSQLWPVVVCLRVGVEVQGRFLG